MTFVWKHPKYYKDLEKEKPKDPKPEEQQDREEDNQDTEND